MFATWRQLIFHEVGFPFFEGQRHNPPEEKSKSRMMPMEPEISASPKMRAAFSGSTNSI
jgi:hypothetical protein